MNTTINLVLIVVAGYLVSLTVFRDTFIAKLREQGGLHKVVLAAG